MAELATVARPYAEAVFELASETDSMDRWSVILSRLAQTAANPAVAPLIGDPRVTDDQLVDLFMSAGGEELSGARDFVGTLAANGRLAALPVVRDRFEELKNEHQGIAEADIATAFPLSETDLGTLVSALERRFKRKVHPSVRVDDSLIGGVRIHVGDEVIDGSVRGKLAAMKSALVAP